MVFLSLCAHDSDSLVVGAFFLHLSSDSASGIFFFCCRAFSSISVFFFFFLVVLTLVPMLTVLMTISCPHLTVVHGSCVPPIFACTFVSIRLSRFYKSVAFTHFRPPLVSSSSLCLESHFLTLLRTFSHCCFFSLFSCYFFFLCYDFLRSFPCPRLA